MFYDRSLVKRVLKMAQSGNTGTKGHWSEFWPKIQGLGTAARKKGSSVCGFMIGTC